MCDLLLLDRNKSRTDNCCKTHGKKAKTNNINWLFIMQIYSLFFCCLFLSFNESTNKTKNLVKLLLFQRKTHKMQPTLNSLNLLKWLQFCKRLNDCVEKTAVLDEVELKSVQRFSFPFYEIEYRPIAILNHHTRQVNCFKDLTIALQRHCAVTDNWLHRKYNHGDCISIREIYLIPLRRFRFSPACPYFLLTSVHQLSNII